MGSSSPSPGLHDTRTAFVWIHSVVQKIQVSLCRLAGSGLQGTTWGCQEQDAGDAKYTSMPAHMYMAGKEPGSEESSSLQVSL